MVVSVVIEQEQITTEQAIARTANWIYRERDIRFTWREPNFPLPLFPPGVYDLELHDFGGLVTHEEAAAKFRELDLQMQRAGSLHLFLEAIRQYPDLLHDHPVVSNVSWTSPAGDHGVVYADLGLGDRPGLYIHYAQSGFSSRCRFLG